MNDNWWHPLGNEITCLDTGYVRPKLAACYLVESDGQAAFIDCGTSKTLPRALSLLQACNLRPEQVAYVIPTHVHLDHAGGAGAMMAAFPDAKLIVHPRGARHLIDPIKLTAGVKAVYGEKVFQREFGELKPIAEERVIEAPDGFELDLGQRHLTFLDTPGHARHHFCVYDEMSGGIFTGDTFGLSYREFDTAQGPFFFATTTPVQFDPAAWETTLDRLLALEPRFLYLTHFSGVAFENKLADQLRASIRAFADIALQAEDAEVPAKTISQNIRRLLLDQLAAHGCSLPEKTCESLLAGDIDLNTQGLEIWLSQRNANQ